MFPPPMALQEEAAARAVEAVCDAAIDFGHALELATSVADVETVRELVTSCIAVLTLVEKAGFDRAAALSGEQRES